MWVRVAGGLGALAVVLGAFGTHALPRVVTDPGLQQAWDVGARYHLVHAVAVAIVGLHPARPRWAGAFFSAGILLFSGSLYAMALTGHRWLGAITPLGGLAFIAGWIALAAAPSTKIAGAP